jgi:hypothetical protein
MKKTSVGGIALLLALSAGPSMAQQNVQGYERSNGTYVQPYVRSTPNDTTLDNYSTRGNINPYTGVPGTRSPGEDYQPYAPAPSAVSPYSAPGKTVTGVYGH